MYIHIHIHSNTYIHIHITEVKYFIVCFLIGEMDTQALFAGGMYTTLDIYEKCRADNDNGNECFILTYE